ncbi:MAG: HipA domain-containing protein [Deltaproteobacteria bacterium]|nr:HipA domain-containing protein [Deltaproteobacteria bacterium]
MVFNVMANNRDDHVKNFAFMIDANQEWVLTPAYDLMYAEVPGGEHSMDLLGEGFSPGGQEVIQLGKKSGLSTNEVNNSIELVMTAVEKWPEYAQIAGVTKKTMNYIQKRMNRNLFPCS